MKFVFDCIAGGIHLAFDTAGVIEHALMWCLTLGGTF